MNRYVVLADLVALLVCALIVLYLYATRKRLR